MGSLIKSAHKSGAPVVFQAPPLPPKPLQHQLSFADTHDANLKLFAPEAEPIHSTCINALGFRHPRGSALYSPLDEPEKVLCDRFLGDVPAPAKATTRPLPAPPLLVEDFSSTTASSLYTHMSSRSCGLSPRSSISLATYDSNKTNQSSSLLSESLRSTELCDFVDSPSRSRPHLASSKLNYLKKFLGKDKRVKRSQSELKCTPTASHCCQASTTQPRPISNRASTPCQSRCQIRLTVSDRKLQAREPTTIDHRKALYADRFERPDPINTCAPDSGDVVFSGSIIFSKNLLVDRHKVPSGPRMTPAQASTNPSQESSDEEMESIIAGLRSIGPPGKALTTSNCSSELNNNPEPGRGTPHLSRSRLPIPSSSLYKSSPKFLHRQKSLERSLAEKSSSQVNPVTSRNKHQEGPSKSPIPTHSLSHRDLYDSDEEMDFTMANLRSIAPPSKQFRTSKPLNDSSSTITPIPRFSRALELKSADPAGVNVHARQSEGSQDEAPGLEFLVEEGTDRRSSFGSLLEVDEDEVDEFMMPTWPAMTSTTKSPFDKTPLAGGLYRPDECSISTRMLVQQEKRVMGKASNGLRIV